MTVLFMIWQEVGDWILLISYGNCLSTKNEGMVSSPEKMANPTEIPTHMPDGFLKTIEVEPVGRWFLAHWERLHSGRGLSTG